VAAIPRRNRGTIPVKILVRATLASLRPATARDREYLFSLHRATMRDVIERTWGTWDEAWQRAHFEARFDPPGISVITVEGRDVGTLWLERRPAELYVAEIQVSPEMQGRGIGTAVLLTVLARAGAEALPVTLQVLRANAGARRLYERLGFRVTGEAEPHVLMRHDGSGRRH
jgi:ribosomal protein S18 acetylase RimI-like enzyme